jgi:putative protease
MAYSGHCTISNFTAGRDSNRGGCIQSCRFPYHMQAEGHQTGTQPVTFMSSKDLWGLQQVEDFFKNQICSLKIEGRMKSSFYVAMACKAYRQLIDNYAEQQILSDALLQQAAQELRSAPHRDYCSGSLAAPAAMDSVYETLDGINTGSHQYLGLVLDTNDEHIVLRLFMPLAVGDEVELVPFRGEPLRCRIERLRSVAGDNLQAMRQDSVVCIPRADAMNDIARLNVVRIAQAA